MPSTLPLLRAASLLCLVAGATALPQASPCAELPALFTRLGCYAGKVNGVRTLTSASTGGDSMTVGTCAAFCSAYKYFGLEYGRECWCGDEQLATAVDESQCSFPCSGNSKQTCGAGAIQDLYINNRFIQRKPATLKIPYIGCFVDDGPKRVLPQNLLGSDDMTAAKCADHCAAFEFFGKAPESECSFSCSGDKTTICGAGKRISVWGTRLIAPRKVDGYTYQGCYTDKNNARALTGQVFREPSMTPKSCAASCAGYPWFGLEYGTQCFCGTELLSSAKKVAEYECNMECGGNADIPCGDADRLNVYFNPDVKPVGNPKTVGKYSAKGCYTDSQSLRSLGGAVLRRSDMTVEMCAGYCVNFEHFGLEFSSQCFCGNSLGGEKVSKYQCGMLCAGNNSQLCGGPDRLTVYGRDEKSAAFGDF
ncbi:WSC domain-containing protein [Immersiella caudata]|uniref:WSC domain-containing protein n=1 Tax=Immersiella caudata TaxID=314043 RepID=A0AA40CCJ5_9PEZI|nr:WSC domain-containing protein [Immersiella caudata]